MSASQSHVHLDSLAAGAPAFQLWRTADIPEAWKSGPDRRQLEVASAEMGIPVADLVPRTALELGDWPQ